MSRYCRNSLPSRRSARRAALRSLSGAVLLPNFAPGSPKKIGRVQKSATSAHFWNLCGRIYFTAARLRTLFAHNCYHSPRIPQGTDTPPQTCERERHALPSSFARSQSRAVLYSCGICYLRVIDALRASVGYFCRRFPRSHAAALARFFQSTGKFFGMSALIKWFFNHCTARSAPPLLKISQAARRVCEILRNVVSIWTPFFTSSLPCDFSAAASKRPRRFLTRPAEPEGANKIFYIKQKIL